MKKVLIRLDRLTHQPTVVMATGVGEIEVVLIDEAAEMVWRLSTDVVGEAELIVFLAEHLAAGYDDA